MVNNGKIIKDQIKIDCEIMAKSKLKHQGLQHNYGWT